MNDISSSKPGAAEVLREFSAMSGDVREALAKAGLTAREMSARLDELEQKAARGGGGGGSPADLSPGAQFVANPELKSFADYRARPSRLSMEFKATLTGAANSAGALAPTGRDPEVTVLARRRLTVRSLLNTVNASTAAVEYARQKSRTIAAAPVAEAALKPESALEFELVTTPIRTIAHWLPASRQILDDAPQLRDTINNELLHGLAEVEETQLLSGDGTGQNLLGLVPQATAFVAPFVITNATMVDKIGLGLLQLSQGHFDADGIVLNSADWWRVRLLKNADGEYVMGPPGADVTPSLFGLPVVATTALTEGNFLVGAFRAAATLYDRWTPRIEVSTEHSDFFVRNLVAILAEERIGLAVKRPGALIYGSFA